MWLRRVKRAALATVIVLIAVLMKELGLGALPKFALAAVIIVPVCFGPCKHETEETKLTQ